MNETDNRKWSRTILTLLVLWIGAGILLIGPLLFLPGLEKGSNPGAIPFLASPFLAVVVIPALSSARGFWREQRMYPAMLFPLVLMSHFFLCYGLFHSPSSGACFQGGLFLFCFGSFLMGVVWLCRGLGLGPFPSQWVSTLVGLLLTTSFVISSPIVDLYTAESGTRKWLIELSTQYNPVLAMGGDILGQDVLRGSFLYETISIGRFYHYSSPEWGGLALSFLLIGSMTGGIGLFLYLQFGNRQMNDE